VAIYHLSVKPVSRSGGRSATAAAAYRAAERLRDESTGQTFDYTRKRGIEHREIVLPSDAVKRDIQWPRERQALWNAAEAAEKRKDARVAREYEVALPHELSKTERVALVRAFAQELADRYGAVVDVALHAPHRDGDQRNHHAHVLTTTRVLTPTGLAAKTTIELKDADRAKQGLPPAKVELTAIRARWAELTNEHLAAKGSAARVDHRSLEAQGVERAPTTHVGPAVTALERRGIRTEVGYRLQAEATARLERAAELGRLERDSRDVGQQILVLSTDVAAALRERVRAGPAGAPPASRADAERDAGASVERWQAIRTDRELSGPASRESPVTPGADRSRDGPAR
jgi:ATP-dependent exoDNAse (exonuclease V) alpha subunit